MANPQQPFQGQPAPQQPAPQPGAPYNQPQPPVQQQQQSVTPQSDQPQRHYVHHSYIWLGSIQVAFTVFIIMFFSVLSSMLRPRGDAGAQTGGVPILLLVVGGCALFFVVFMAIVVVIQWWSYKHLYYTLGTEEFSLYSGIFNKKRMHVPYQRIQSVDQHATLLQRIFGVCTVNIDTAGGASNSAARVPYVQKAQAEELRRELFARKQFAVAVQDGAVPAQAAQAVAAATGVAIGGSPVWPTGASAVPGAPVAVPGVVPAPGNVLDAPAEIWGDVRGVFGGQFVDTGRVTYEYGLSNRELVFTGLSNSTTFFLVIVAVIGAFLQFASEMIPILTHQADPVVGAVVASSVQMFGGNPVAAAIVALLIAAVVIWVMSAVGTCIAFGGFKARRRDSRIEVERGLLQHQFQGVDVDRVQSIIVKQSFVRRLLGYCELTLGKVDAAAEGSDDQQGGMAQQGLVIHPFVKMSRVPDILAGIIPEFADVPADNTPVAPVALRRALIRRCILQGTGFWLAVIVAAGQLLANLVFPASIDASDLLLINTASLVAYGLCVLLLILDAVGAVLWFRGSGFAYNRQFMQVSNGGLARETISFPRRKIQYGIARTNPFQRRARTVTISARTAAGIGGTTVRLIDVCEEDAAAWLAWLEPRGNMVE